MGKQPETLFKERVLEDIRSIPYSWAEKINQVSIRGTPDILACLKGFFVALELKMEDEEPDPLQRYKLDKIREAKGVALSVRPTEWPKVFKYLRQLAQRQTRRKKNDSVDL